MFRHLKSLLSWDGIGQHQTGVHGHDHLVVHLKITIYSIVVIISAVIVHLANVFGKSVDRGSDLSSHVHGVFGVRETLLQISGYCRHHCHRCHHHYFHAMFQTYLAFEKQSRKLFALLIIRILLDPPHLRDQLLS